MDKMGPKKFFRIWQELAAEMTGVGTGDNLVVGPISVLILPELAARESTYATDSSGSQSPQSSGTIDPSLLENPPMREDDIASYSQLLADDYLNYSGTPLTTNCVLIGTLTNLDLD